MKAPCGLPHPGGEDRRAWWLWCPDLVLVQPEAAPPLIVADSDDPVVGRSLVEPRYGSTTDRSHLVAVPSETSLLSGCDWTTRADLSHVTQVSLLLVDMKSSSPRLLIIDASSGREHPSCASKGLLWESLAEGPGIQVRRMQTQFDSCWGPDGRPGWPVPAIPTPVEGGRLTMQQAASCGPFDFWKAFWTGLLCTELDLCGPLSLDWTSPRTRTSAALPTGNLPTELGQGHGTTFITLDNVEAGGWTGPHVTRRRL